MAGSCPGVEVAARRRRRNQRESFTRERLQLSSSATGATLDMDETALAARRRLEQKLGLFPSSRSSELQLNESRDCHRKSRTGRSKDMLRRSWPFRSNSSRNQVCSVCLEEFRTKQPVMDLSCSHKYHSQCLLPWLASHPHCPYCRTPIQSMLPFSQ